MSFVVLVLLPIAAAADYYFVIATDQYVAELRFTLSTVDTPHVDRLALLGGTAIPSPASLESQILVQYIASRAIVDDIGTSLDLRRLFSPPHADWWSRLPQDAPIEVLVRYWKGQVDPFYDPATGTVSVRVRAFAPQDALRLAQAIVAACEALVNELSARARHDTLQRAKADVAQAQARLSAALGNIREFRDREGLIDPARAAATNGALATRLRDELLQAKSELATLRAYMRDGSPTVNVLTARIRSLETQERSLADELTGRHAGHPDALSGILATYDELESQHKFAEAAYQHALLGLDQARADADRQHVFVAGFVPPSLPQEALYPRRWRSLGTVALMAFAFWAIGGLVMQSVREHLS